MEKQYKAKHTMKQASSEVTFVYAWHLVKSPYSNDIKKGISLLKGKWHSLYISPPCSPANILYIGSMAIAIVFLHVMLVALY